ncbi:MAG TPA: cysteine desulfurase [Candidatus Izemoplasmatales bacterium]|nr:cysteine desulfurase [Candidatus Izemoplasmatales bacterium]
MKKNPWVKDFPQIQDGYRYFDSAATSLKPKVVIDQMNDYNLRLSANIHRGMYAQSQEATEIYEEARRVVADFIHGREDEIVFTRGTTASLNLVARAFGMAILNEGDEILSDEAEHHSSILPWLNVSHQRKANLSYIPLSKEGKLTIESFKESISNRTKIVAIHHVSNVMGYQALLKDMIDIAHEHGAYVVVDGAQAIQHMPVNVKNLDADFYAFSGHKMLGPTGIGVLYGKFDLLDKMNPIEYGGDMALDVMKHQFSWKETPIKFEAGTMPIAEAFGLKAAIEYFQSIGFKHIHTYTETLYNYLMKKLNQIEDVDIYNQSSDTFIFTFNLKNVPSHDAISYFSEKNIALRSGQHCAKLMHDFLGINSSLRGTIYLYNTYEDVDVLVEEIKAAVSYFKALGF